MIDRPDQGYSREQRRRHVDLLGDVAHRGVGELVGSTREPGLDLEELQQQRERYLELRF